MVACAETYEPPDRDFGTWGTGIDGEDNEEEGDGGGGNDGGGSGGDDGDDGGGGDGGGGDGGAVGEPGEDPDGDGYTNAEEESAGTNPNYAYSHPYTGDYRVGYCNNRPNPTGPTKRQNYSDGEVDMDYYTYQRGDVAENFTMRDQYGESVDLYSFCGKHVMVVVSAGWCGPCRAEAEGLQALAEAFPGAQILQVLGQDNSQDIPSLSFVQGWASQYGFENVAALGPLSAPTTYEEYFSAPSSQFEDDGYIPTIYHLDEEMTVISADQDVQSPDTWL